MIDDEWGSTKLVEMLQGYGEERRPRTTSRQVLGISPEEFDKQFNEYLNDLLGEKVDGAAKVARTDEESARSRQGKELGPRSSSRRSSATNSIPDFVEGGNPYIDARRSQLRARATRQARPTCCSPISEHGGKSPELDQAARGLLDEAGRRDRGDRGSRQGLIYICAGRRRAALRSWASGCSRKTDLPEALREYQVLLAMDPLDQAGAHYNLARTYHKMRDPTTRGGKFCWRWRPRPIVPPGAKTAAGDRRRSKGTRSMNSRASDIRPAWNPTIRNRAETRAS